MEEDQVQVDAAAEVVEGEDFSVEVDQEDKLQRLDHHPKDKLHDQHQQLPHKLQEV